MGIGEAEAFLSGEGEPRAGGCPTPSRCCPGGGEAPVAIPEAWLLLSRALGQVRSTKVRAGCQVGPVGAPVWGPTSSQGQHSMQAGLTAEAPGWRCTGEARGVPRSTCHPQGAEAEQGLLDSHPRRGCGGNGGGGSGARTPSVHQEAHTTHTRVGNTPSPCAHPTWPPVHAAPWVPRGPGPAQRWLWGHLLPRCPGSGAGRGWVVLRPAPPPACTCL